MDSEGQGLCSLFAFSPGRRELYEEVSVDELKTTSVAWELDSLHSLQIKEWQRV